MSCMNTTSSIKAGLKIDSTKDLQKFIDCIIYKNNIYTNLDFFILIEKSRYLFR